MKVLITGGCGFLGSNLAAHFLARGDAITIMDALYRHGSELNLAWLRSKASPNRLSFHQHDLAEPDAVNSIFQKEGPFDFICHVGGQAAMTTSLKDPRRDLQTNVLGTFNVLEAARRHSPDALVAYSSTNKVYGNLEWVRYEQSGKRYVAPDYPHGFDESVPLDFASPYGCSKGAADQYMRDWHRNFGLKTVVFRHSSIYGGRQFATYDQGWIGWFCSQAIQQQRDLQTGKAPCAFTISGNGFQVRDVLHGDDLVRLYQAAYDRRNEVAGHIFNIGGGMENSLSLLELFDLLQEEVRIELACQRIAPRQSDQKFFVADIREAGRMLGWKPQVAKYEGIVRMLDWVRARTEGGGRTN
jgi:CDP-paratose 2-epimerase